MQQEPCQWRKRREGRAQHRERARAWHEHVRQVLGAEPGEHWFLRGRRYRACCMGAPELGGANPLLGLLLSRGGGLLPVFVLHLLAQGPRYGNEIMSEIEAQTEGGWVSNPGAVYPLLSLFEAEGLVEGSWEVPHKRHRRFYSLTAEGRDELRALKELVRPGLEDALRILGQIVQELYGEEGEGSADAAPPSAPR